MNEDSELLELKNVTKAVKEFLSTDVISRTKETRSVLLGILRKFYSDGQITDVNKHIIQIIKSTWNYTDEVKLTNNIK